MISAMTIIREARLRPEYSDLYPEIEAGAWLPASQVGATILMSQLRAAHPKRLGDRLLPEDHFDFRGGQIRGGATELRTRDGESGVSLEH